MRTEIRDAPHVLTTTQSYDRLASNLAQSLERAAAKPPVRRETENYLAKIGSVKSIDDLLRNDRLFRFAMKAFGMDDLAYAKGLVRKALTEGIDARDSFANRLVDPRLKEFVGAFNFVRYGAATTAFDAVQKGTVDRYVRLSLEEEAGARNEGVRLALYFERKAPSMTTPYAILADKALYKVVQTALDLPDLSAGTDIDKKAREIAAKLPMGDLQDPAKLKALLKKFTVRWELSNPSQPPRVPLLLASTQGSGLSPGVLEALQRLRIGGK